MASDESWKRSLRSGDQAKTERQTDWQPPKGVNRYTPPSVVRARTKSTEPKATVSVPKKSTADTGTSSARSKPPLGSIDNPFKLVDAKRTPDALSQFHPEYVKLMDEATKQTIPLIPGIKAERTQKGGSYELSADKQRQAPLDRTMERLTREHGTNPDFKGGPKAMDGRIFSRMKPGEEHIFGLREETGMFGETTTKMKVLPRDEVIKKDGKYFEARHTHSEFGDKSSSARPVKGAGTMKDGQFNFRTGHYEVESSSLPDKRKLRAEIQEQVQFARDKTLPSRPQHFQETALTYPSHAHNTHTASEEIPLPKRTR